MENLRPEELILAAGALRGWDSWEETGGKDLAASWLHGGTDYRYRGRHGCLMTCGGCLRTCGLLAPQIDYWWIEIRIAG